VHASCAFHLFFRLSTARPPTSPLFPYTTLFRSIAIPVLAVYVFWGRNARSHTVRQVAWIAGASQALAVVVAIFAFLLSWLALARSEEHTSELQSLAYLVCRLLLEKKKSK